MFKANQCTVAGQLIVAKQLMRRRLSAQQFSGDPATQPPNQPLLLPLTCCCVLNQSEKPPKYRSLKHAGSVANL